MAGRGPTPKDPADRARRNVDPTTTTTVEFKRAKQPTLPAKMPGGAAWPARTRAWWKRWATDPRAQRFDSAAWDYLLDTAVVHGRLWSGEWKAAGELRLRVERFGMTPGDRARLRIQLTDGLEGMPEPTAAGSPDPTPAPARPGARTRHGDLRVVDGGA